MIWNQFKHSRRFLEDEEDSPTVNITFVQVVVLLYNNEFAVEGRCWFNSTVHVWGCMTLYWISWSFKMMKSFAFEQEDSVRTWKTGAQGNRIMWMTFYTPSALSLLQTQTSTQSSDIRVTMWYSTSSYWSHRLEQHMKEERQISNTWDNWL